MLNKIDQLFQRAGIWLLFLLSIKLLSTLLTVFVFTRFTPLVDANLYLSGYYANEAFLRTRFIQKIVSLLSGFAGALFTHAVFGLISIAGLFFYYVRGGRRWQFGLLLLLPSTLIWTSVIGKESIFFGAFTLALCIWGRFVVRQCTAADYLLLGVSAMVCGLLRPHYAVVLVWLFVSAAFIHKLKHRALPWLALLAILGGLFVFIFAWESLLYRGFGGIESGARASRFGVFGIEPGTDAGFVAFKALLPLGGILGIVGPLPMELIARLVFIPFFIEGVVILLFPVGVYWYALRRSFEGKELFKSFFWMCLVPAIGALMILHAPFGLLNPGSATRWRVNFEAMFHMAPLLLIFSFLDRAPRENHPLSP